MEWTKFAAALQTNPRLRAAGLLGGRAGGRGAVQPGERQPGARGDRRDYRAAAINAPVPATDPFSPLWQQSPAADIPLSAQQMWQPGGGSVQAVQVRALEDGQHIAFLVSWADTTRNDYVKDCPAMPAAIQLPIDPTTCPTSAWARATAG